MVQDDKKPNRDTKKPTGSYKNGTGRVKNLQDGVFEWWLFGLDNFQFLKPSIGIHLVNECCLLTYLGSTSLYLCLE